MDASGYFQHCVVFASLNSLVDDYCQDWGEGFDKRLSVICSGSWRAEEGWMCTWGCHCGDHDITSEILLEVTKWVEIFPKFLVDLLEETIGFLLEDMLSWCGGFEVRRKQ